MAGALALPCLLQNPDFFSSRNAGGTIIGAFNPSGYTETQVQRLLAATCEAELSGFGTQTREDGLVDYSATCPTWRSGARAVEYQRTGGTDVLIEITGTDGAGNLIFARIETSV